MAESFVNSDALLDLRRAVGMLAAKLGTEPWRWKEAAEQHSIEYLLGQLVMAWHRLQADTAPR